MMFSIVKISVVIILFTKMFTSAHLVIDIEPEEMQRIAEVLVENYISHNLTPRTTSTRNIVFSHIKKISLGVVQLMGITLSLVSANLITSKFEPVIESDATINNDNITVLKPSCNRDFGCNRNVCWRACDADSSDNGKNKSLSWCFTTPKPEARKYQQCIHSHDCSPCWECLGGCHSKRNN